MQYVQALEHGPGVEGRDGSLAVYQQRTWELAKGKGELTLMMATMRLDWGSDVAESDATRGRDSVARAR